MPRFLDRFVRWAQESALVSTGLRRRMLNAIGAQISVGAEIEANCRLGSADITMEPGSKLNAFAFYDGYAPLIFERNARTAIGLTILTQSHHIADDWRRRSTAEALFRKPIRIGQGSWIGANATLLPGVTIGAGCVIAAGSLVTRSTEPNGVYANTAGNRGIVCARRIRELPAGD